MLCCGLWRACEAEGGEGRQLRKLVEALVCDVVVEEVEGGEARQVPQHQQGLDVTSLQAEDPQLRPRLPRVFCWVQPRELLQSAEAMLPALFDFQSLTS